MKYISTLKQLNIMCTSDRHEDKHLSKEMKNLIKGNALKYMRFKDRLDDIDIAELNEFRYEVEQAFSRISVPVYFVDYDPYETLQQMTNDILLKGELLISNLHNDSKLLPGDLNLKFRAVHDYLHYLLQQPFGFVGEYKVYQAQKHIHKSKLRRQILYSEVVLQAAYCEYFGKFADNQKIVL